MADLRLLDTDVSIDYLRGRSEAARLIAELGDRPIISCITVAELYSGVREGKEVSDLESFLRASVVAEVDEQIARLAGLYRRDFGRSHGVGLADAVIAATAAKWGAILVTLNAKHFPMVTNIN